MMIVDAHMHLWDHIAGLIDGGTVPVHAVRDGMVEIGDRAVLGMPATFEDCRATVERAMGEFNAAGVDVGVVVQEYLDGEQNEYLLDVHRRYADRFVMHGLPDFYHPDVTAQQAKSLLMRGFDGIKIPAQHLPANLALDDERFMPIYALLESTHHVLAVDLTQGATQVPAMENILRRHPRLRVAIGHLGLAGRGDWMAQIRLCRHENVYVETGGIIWLFRHQGPGFPGAVAAIKTVAREVGMEKIMWGSDWPRTMVDFTYRQSLAFISPRDSDFTDHERALLTGANAARLYRLSAPAKPRTPAKLITES